MLTASLRRTYASHRQKTLEKKAFQRRYTRKNACECARMCYFSRRFSLYAATVAPRITLITIFIRGVAQYGEKGWRTDEVGSPDSDFQRHRALTQAGRRRFRLPRRRDQEEPAR